MSEAKGLQLIVSEITSKKGTIFNKEDFNKVLMTLLNEPEYIQTLVKTYDAETDKLELVENHPVADYREALVNFLVKGGLDKQDATNFMAKHEFKISEISAMYQLFTEAMHLYMQTGKKFNLPRREQCIGSIGYKDICEKVKEGEMKMKDKKDPSKEVVIPYSTTLKNHVKVVVSSSCPKWKKIKNSKKH